jgi:hypothetical protein
MKKKKRPGQHSSEKFNQHSSFYFLYLIEEELAYIYGKFNLICAPTRTRAKTGFLKNNCIVGTL